MAEIRLPTYWVKKTPIIEELSKAISEGKKVEFEVETPNDTNTHTVTCVPSKLQRGEGFTIIHANYLAEHGGSTEGGGLTVFCNLETQRGWMYGGPVIFE